jgi:hypothetical protein
MVVFHKLGGKDEKREREAQAEAHVEARLAELVSRGASPDEALVVWQRLQRAVWTREHEAADHVYNAAKAKQEQERARKVPKDKLAYYRMLAIPAGASLADIERAYRHYVRAMHPDKFRQHVPYMREQEQRMRELFRFIEWARDAFQERRESV